MTVSEFAENAAIELSLSSSELKRLADDFRSAMERGLAGGPSSLKMLPSFIAGPSGKERGEVIAIDFGGTNVRVLKVMLDGSGGFEVMGRERFPLKDPSGAYDLSSAEASAESLFDHIAEKAAALAEPGKVYPLGHTFSFPCSQRGINRATLISWTKEIKTSGVEGLDVNLLLSQAFERAGFSAIRPAALINDTVGTLLAAAYEYRHVDLASICGTGHNSCYLEPRHPLTGKPMIVNMESGNFDAVRQTRWDERLDAESDKPGSQKAEKMASGRYVGEVVVEILRDMAGRGLIPRSAALERGGAIGGAILNGILSDGPGLEDCARIAARDLGLPGLDYERRRALKAVAEAVTARSARLVGATFAGTVMRIDPGLERPHVVAIDGSLYELMPGYDGHIRGSLDEILGSGAAKVTTVLAKDGSGLGAAIAAAIAAGLD